MYREIFISRSGEGDYRSLTEAVNACSANPQEPVRFRLRNGIYRERPFIELEDYIIEGESTDGTILTAACGGWIRGRGRRRQEPSVRRRCSLAAGRRGCAISP